MLDKYLKMFHFTFYLRRMHSLCGLVLLGLFLLEHLFTNSTVLVSARVFNEAVARLAAIPYPIFLFLEIFFIALPFLFHIVYGLYIIWQAKNNAWHYRYVNNWQFLLQRYTAVFLVFFLFLHIGYLRIYLKDILGLPINFALLQHLLHNPFWFILYFLGMVAAIFHLCNGVTTFCMTWGIAKGRRIQKVINAVMMLGAVLLSGLTAAFMAVYILS